MTSHENEPGGQDVNPLYNLHDDQIFRNILSSSQLVLQRALWQRNIIIKKWQDRQGRRRWHAIGPGSSLRFRLSMPSSTTVAIRRITNDKVKTKEKLIEGGLNAPYGIITKSKKEAMDWFSSNSIGAAVAKPLVGSGGAGVYSNIKTPEELENAIDVINKDGDKKIIIEEYIPGNEHRILVVGGKVVAATLRRPANVTGDGTSSINTLIDLKNKERRKNPYLRKNLIIKDKITENLLRSCKKTLDSVPRAGETVYLKAVSNLGAGGDSEEIFDHVHKGFIDIAQRCWGVFSPYGLSHFGIDLIAENISKAPSNQKWSIIEVNVNCDLPLHHFPVSGKAFDAAGELANYLFPESKVQVNCSRLIEITGKVQGVGMRNFIAKHAVFKGVHGYCQNRDNGDVLVHLEGSRNAVTKMQEIIAEGTPKSIVARMEIIQSPVQRFDRFEIR